MKNKTLILSILGIVAVLTVVHAIIPKPSHEKPSSNLVYCSSEGTLTDEMPIQSHRSYCLKSDSEGKTYSADVSSEYSFWIIDDQGNTIKNFETTHTKQMHVIVVRKDLKFFEHTHPNFDAATGKFSFSDLTFPTNGEYRIFADFAPVGVMKDSMGMPMMVTLYEDIKVGATYSPELLGSEEKTKIFDGYQVMLSMTGKSGGETMLTFDIKQNGKPVTDLEPYLGALGHSVILKEGTLDFIHAHPVETNPQNGKVSFMVYFPEGGKYKIFTQFQRNSELFTTDFVVSVPQNAALNSTGEVMMSHEQHGNSLMPVSAISHAHGLAVDISDSERVYIATHYGLLVLQDGQLYELGPKKDDYMGFLIHPDEAGIFFSSGHPSTGGNLGVQMSSDGGSTWNKISNGANGPVDFHAMAISPVNPNILYGSYRNGLQRSDDGGTNWQVISSGLPIIQLATDPQNELIVYAATPTGIQVSLDKGKTWSTYSKSIENEEILSLAFNPTDNKVAFAFSINRGLIKTTDGGTKWEPVSVFKNGPVLQIAFSKSDSKIIYIIVGSSNLYKTIDNGATWEQLK